MGGGPNAFFCLRIVEFIAKLIGAEGARLLREDGTGETPQALAPRRLPGPPAESEAPGTEINNLI